jgi:DNA-directed RNA polymerase subunit RPC12/RpoP
MKVEVYKCDRCETILTADNGILVHGNIYSAEKGEVGLIGDNNNHLCAHCFSKAMTKEFIKSIVNFNTATHK